MTKIKIKNKTTTKIMPERIKHCNTWWSRLIGLLGSNAEKTKGCLLVNCNAIHTFGMTYPLDVYVLDKDHKVIEVIKNMKSNRFSPVFFNGVSILELPSKDEAFANVGDELIVERV